MIAIIQKLMLVAGAVLLLVAAYIDVRRFIIPNWINASLLALGLLFALSVSDFSWMINLGIGATVFLCGALLYQFRLLGGGDVKLLAVMSFWAGSANLFPLLFIMAVVGGGLSLIYLLKSFLRRADKTSTLSLAESATLLHADVVQEGGAAVLQRARASDALRQPIPYGVAIAVAGLYVFIMIAVHLGYVHG